MGDHDSPKKEEKEEGKTKNAPGEHLTLPAMVIPSERKEKGGGGSKGRVKNGIAL